MQYLRQNAERLVVKHMLTTDPTLIQQLNLKEWFWKKEGKVFAWAILKAFKDDRSGEDVFEYIDWNKTHLSEQELRQWIDIDLVDDESMQQVIIYFKFMGMLFEMYVKRDDMTQKEVAAIQACSELVKRKQVNQKVINIVFKLYERYFGDQFYNKKMKQDIIANELKQNENKILNKYNGEI